MQNIPGIQTHRNVPGSSRHDPSFWHGCDSHSLTFASHLGPVNPCEHMHAKLPGVLTHIPSRSHGVPAHKQNTKISYKLTLKFRHIL